MLRQKSVRAASYFERAVSVLTALLLLINLFGTTELFNGTPAQAAGAPARLAFTTSPGGGASSVVFASQPVVTIQDASGATASSNATVTLSITAGTGAAGAVLAGTTTVAALNGVATFSGLSINLAGTGYTLTATSAGLTSAASTAFSVSAGPAARLAFTTSPVGSPAGTPFATQPVVKIQDAAGNTASSNATVVLSITSGSGTGNAQLSGSVTVPALNGVATFSGLTINLAGAGYTLTAASTGLASGVSQSFNMAASAAKLAFTTSPAGATAGLAFTTQPVVAVQDANGSIVTTSTTPVTLAITSGTGASGAVLYGTATVNATAGLATFSSLGINLADTGYTLTATSGALLPGTSNTFTVVPAAAIKLGFTTPPAGAIAGVPFVTQPIVTVQDTSGNTVTTSSVPILLTITPGTGTSGATLSGAANVTAAAGVATYAGLSISLAGSGYTLTATSPGLVSATSPAFYVAGVAAKLAFITPPGGATANSPFVTQPVVAMQDASGNTVTAAAGAITIAISSGTGTGGALLSGATTLGAVSGLATFSGLSINLPGSGYTLVATSGSLIPATSSAFNVAGTAAKLAFITSPTASIAGSAFAQQPAVAVQDASGSTVTTSSAPITVAITSGTGTGGATLAGTLTLTAVNGVATFSGLGINLAGSAYTLTATSPGLTTAASTGFNISDIAARLVFTTSPTASIAGVSFPTQPVVSVQDSTGHTVTTSSAPITLTITAGAGTTGAVLSGTATVSASSGVATFGGLSINLPGSAYSLTATSSGLTTAASNTFYVATVPGQLTTTTTLAASVNPSAYGQSVTFSATVTGASSTPTGSVTFMDNGTALTTVTLASGQAAYTTAGLGAGSHAISAVYNSDTATYITSSGALTQTVNQSTGLATATGLTSSANPSYYGRPITLLATVTAASGTPTGTITFLDGSTILGYVALSSGQAAFATSSLSVGSHTILANYANDTATYTASTGSIAQTVYQSLSTTTVLTVSINPSRYGQPVTFAATVTASNGTPTGTVTFQDSGATLGSSGLSAGQATYTTSSLITGTHYLTAVYTPDSTSWVTSTGTLTQTVNASISQMTSTGLTSSVNPSTYGQPVTLFARVNAASGTPTGSVTFQEGSISLGSAGLSSGQAIFTTAGLTVGSHSIIATYLGDPGLFNTSSGTMVQVVNAVPAPTSTTPARPASFTVSNLTVTPSPVDVGKPVTFNVTVTNGGDASGSYTVNLKLNDTLLYTQPVNLDGQKSQVVTFTTTLNAAGAYVIAIDNLKTNFDVKSTTAATTPTPTPAPTRNTNWWIIGGIVVGLGVIAFFVVKAVARPKRWWE